MLATPTRLMALSVILAVPLLFAACARQTPVVPQQTSDMQEKTAVASNGVSNLSEQAPCTDQMKDVLAKADQVDGTSDKTVSKCAACNLAMNGVHDHALKVGEYTLLFCSDDCKQTYATNLEKAVLGTKLPIPNQSATP